MQSGATYLSVLRDEEKYFMRRLAETSDQKTINAINIWLKQVRRDIEMEEKRENTRNTESRRA